MPENEPKPTAVAAPSPTAVAVPLEVQEIVSLINSDQVGAWKMEKDSDGTVRFQGDTPDGNSRILIEKVSAGPYARTTTETTTKPSTIAERRELVSFLRDEGKKQTEIAARAKCSQKTVSNDLKALGKK